MNNFIVKNCININNSKQCETNKNGCYFITSCKYNNCLLKQIAILCEKSQTNSKETLSLKESILKLLELEK